MVALAALGKYFQLDFAIGLVLIDILAPVPARGEVVETTGEFQLLWARYGRRLPGTNATLQDLTAFPCDGFPFIARAH